LIFYKLIINFFIFLNIMIIKNKIDELENYLTDASNYKSKAEKVYIPDDKNELQNLLKKLYNNNIPYTISGARTGLTGSACPDKGVIISLEKFDEIKINANKLLATVGTGVIHKDLDNELRKMNLFFPPNPTETNSSIGGNLGTNASGSRTFKYGATRNWVKSIKMLLANGEEIQIERNKIYSSNNKLCFTTSEGNDYELYIDDIGMPEIKHAAGYYIKKNMDLIDLFIGMEGTLGVIYEAELIVLEKPVYVLGLIIFFDRRTSMMSFVNDVRENSITNNKKTIKNTDCISARVIEYFDKYSLDLLRNKYSQIKTDVECAIWVEQEYALENEEIILEKWYSKIERYSLFSEDTWTALNEKEHQEFHDFRHELPVQVYEHLSFKNEKIGTDTAVSISNFNEFYKYLYAKLDSLGLPYLVFGHIGNCHLHANIFYNNKEEMQKAKTFYFEIIKETIRLNGTVSAEHGIGKIKKPYLKEMFKDNIKMMIDIKKILDPKNLLGQGNLFEI